MFSTARSVRCAGLDMRLKVLRGASGASNKTRPANERLCMFALCLRRTRAHVTSTSSIRFLRACHIRKYLFVAGNATQLRTVASTTSPEPQDDVGSSTHVYTTAYQPSEASRELRARVARTILPLRRITPNVPFWELGAHRLPVLWSLYRGLLRAAPTKDVRPI